jgi:hypothetical protein
MADDVKTALAALKAIHPNPAAPLDAQETALVNATNNVLRAIAAADGAPSQPALDHKLVITLASEWAVQPLLKLLASDMRNTSVAISRRVYSAVCKCLLAACVLDSAAFCHCQLHC